MHCTVEKQGILTADGRLVEYDLLACCLEALAQAKPLAYLCDTVEETKRSRSILLASLFIVQTVAFGAGKVCLPIIHEVNLASALLNLK